MTRAEHIKWCKDRALKELEASSPADALASIMSDLNKWEGGQVYNQTQLSMLLPMAQMAAMQGETAMRNWIEGMN